MVSTLDFSVEDAGRLYSTAQRATQSRACAGGRGNAAGRNADAGRVAPASLERLIPLGTLPHFRLLPCSPTWALSFRACTHDAGPGPLRPSPPASRPMVAARPCPRHTPQQRGLGHSRAYRHPASTCVAAAPRGVGRTGRDHGHGSPTKQESVNRPLGLRVGRGRRPYVLTAHRPVPLWAQSGNRGEPTATGHQRRRAASR